MNDVILLSSGLKLNDPNVLIILLSTILVLSFIYNIISEKTSIPSVLMLIITGIAIQVVLKNYFGIDILNAEGSADLPDLSHGLEGAIVPDSLQNTIVETPISETDQLHIDTGVSKVGNPVLDTILSVLGTIGLIMIVLEAALDLKLSKEKYPLIGKSLLIAFLALIGSVFAVAFALQLFIDMDFMQALIYATPLSIMSSAIIIPSVSGLVEHKKEFMVYESAFSDILGIMFFYFLISCVEEGPLGATIDFGISLVLTLIVSVIASYAIVFFFKDMKSHSKLSLLLAILLILYAAGKLLHLAPLLIILLFGMALANHQRVFKIFRKDWGTEADDPIEKIEKEFHLITMESAFVVRTLFFVIFGMSISLASLIDVNIFLVSALVLVALYVVRFIVLKLLLRNDILPELYIAPRGLITILLFYAILEKDQLVTEAFDRGILLYVILISSLIMTFSLIYEGKKKVKETVAAAVNDTEELND